MGWTVKQTVEKTGIPADTLRYYDKEGIVSPKRHENGYRQYDDNDITSLKNVVVMKYAHFSLAEMRSMEELLSSEPSANCNEICIRIIKSKATELKRAICNYQKIVMLMEELLSMVNGIDSYRENQEEVDGFISQIFDDIRSDTLFSTDALSLPNRKEVG